MHLAAPIYEEPSRLSQGLVVGLSVAVVAMAGWFAMMIMAAQDETAASGGEAGAAAGAPVAASVSPVERTAASAAMRSVSPAARSVQFDWPEQFNSSPPTPRTALPLAPPELPATRDPGRGVAWPAAAPVPDTGVPARQPAPQAATATGTNAIVDLLAPPSARDATPVPRPAPARR